jgi:hypothetical protein
VADAARTGLGSGALGVTRRNRKEALPDEQPNSGRDPFAPISYEWGSLLPIAATIVFFVGLAASFLVR